MYFSQSILSVLLCSYWTKGNYHLEFGIREFNRCFQILLHTYHKQHIVWFWVVLILLYCLYPFAAWYTSHNSMLVRSLSIENFSSLIFFHLSFVQQLIEISWWTSILIILPFFLFPFSEIESTLMSISGIFWVRELTLAGVCMPQLFSPFRAELKR